MALLQGLAYRYMAYLGKLTLEVLVRVVYYYGTTLGTTLPAVHSTHVYPPVPYLHGYIQVHVVPSGTL